MRRSLKYPANFEPTRQLAKRLWMPPPDLTLSDWADRYRQLSSESSAEPGQWMTDRAPYQRGIMDALSDARVTTIVFKKSAQVGWTEILLNTIGYYVHQDPAPILCVQPTLEMGQAFSKDRIAPMLRDTPVLRGKVAEAKSKVGDNTLLHKRFAGGHLTIAGANSAAGLASRPIRIALFDEVDRFPASAGTEGDPVSLGVKRTRTFWNRKILLGSTPTIEGASRIDNEFAKSDQRRFHVPCPHCGERHHFEFKNFDWSDAGTVEQPVWICPSCGGMATESDKARMVAAGEWKTTAPFVDIAGFHINEFYSPWSSWSDIFRAYERVKGNREQLKTWVNTTLGETWKNEGEDLDPEGLAARAELYQAEAPGQVALLTAGVDVQSDRFEVSVWGWNETNESWLIEHAVINADPSLPDEWARLDHWLSSKTYQKPCGSTLPITAAAIDSGYLANQVYRYCAQRYGRRFYAVKGVEGENKPAVSVMSKPKAPGPKPPRMFQIGVDALKSQTYGALSTEKPGPNYVHFPTGLDGEYYSQLTAERREIKYVRGFKRYVWQKMRRRNEALDCRVYAHAALYILNPVWAAIKNDKKQKDKKQDLGVKEESSLKRPKKQRTRFRKSGFTNSWRY